MKIRIVAIAVGLAAVGLLASGSASAGAQKVPVCHLNESAGQTTGGAGNVFYYGRVIYVAESAVPAHAAHGDVLSDPKVADGSLSNPDSGLPFIVMGETVRVSDGANIWDLLAQNAADQGVDLGNANCAGRVITSAA